MLSILPTIKLRSRDPVVEEDGLIRAAQRGDRRAFDTLLSTHQGLLRGFLARRADPEAVEDVLQETWVAAWAALPGFNRRSRFKAWLFSIALHKVQDHYRARGRTPVEPLTDDIGTEESMQKDPYDVVDLQDAVRAMLAHLPAPQREVLEMYYYAELTLPEIAQALGRNQNTVKYQFYRAHALAADGLAPLLT